MSTQDKVLTTIENAEDISGFHTEINAPETDCHRPCARKK